MIPSSQILLSYFASHQVLEFYRCFDKFIVYKHAIERLVKQSSANDESLTGFHWGSQEISNTFDENVKAKKQSGPNASEL
jgi:hypothetical protein